MTTPRPLVFKTPGAFCYRVLLLRRISGLKDIALATGVPIVAVAASDEAGLRSGKVRLADLLGPSLVQYECDVGIIQNPHDVGTDGRQSVLWTIEKNRSGPTDVGILYQLTGQYFCFDPQGVRVQGK
jgi:hypothetical protein